jgi:hypothetical protein
VPPRAAGSAWLRQQPAVKTPGERLLEEGGDAARLSASRTGSTFLAYQHRLNPPRADAAPSDEVDRSAFPLAPHAGECPPGYFQLTRVSVVPSTVSPWQSPRSFRSSTSPDLPRLAVRGNSAISCGTLHQYRGPGPDHRPAGQNRNQIDETPQSGRPTRGRTSTGTLRTLTSLGAPPSGDDPPPSQHPPPEPTAARARGLHPTSPTSASRGRRVPPAAPG